LSLSETTELSKPLFPFALNSYSQFGEDRLILDYFNKRDGVFVEIGANDPITLSQTYLFELNGWTGVLVEPLPHLAERLRVSRPGSIVFECAAASPERRGEAIMYTGENDSLASLGAETGGDKVTVRTRTMDDILQEAGLEKIDFLSMDVEGFEMEVFSGFDLKRWAPALILIEDHVHDLQKHRHLVSQGYKLVNRMGCNGWYVPSHEDWSGPCQLSIFERLRKYYLALPLRKLKLFFKRQSSDH
jgi:FkbM family methyltransferase